MSLEGTGFRQFLLQLKTIWPQQSHTNILKKIIFTITLVLTSFIIAAAQSANPLNYSCRMYVEAIEIISTPRYVSYEDHAILSQQMRIPSTKNMKCEMDFEKGSILVDETSIER